MGHTGEKTNDEGAVAGTETATVEAPATEQAPPDVAPGQTTVDQHGDVLSI